MKKLFLSSSFSSVAKLFAEFSDTDLQGKTVSFIPTAAIHEKVNFYVEAGKKALAKLGLLVDELEISTASQKTIKSKLKTNDYIYISGGNTFFLLQELRKSGADKIIAEEINSGKLYIGESAGSMILAPNIEYVQDMDDPNAASDLTDYKALNLIDFYPLPHHTNFPFKKVVETIIQKHQTSLSLTPFSNAQAILVEDDHVEVKTLSKKK